MPLETCTTAASAGPAAVKLAGSLVLGSLMVGSLAGKGLALSLCPDNLPNHLLSQAQALSQKNPSARDTARRTVRWGTLVLPPSVFSVQSPCLSVQESSATISVSQYSHSTARDCSYVP
ncbi:hypothetical protein PYCCODRAFT_123572 [Trametes coccinea BRFM310]|uniref:Uncharacterized protein n=1 Tax=Trametes coccinea (strain BRFM310) TaxID=1353009 RepID=A0A1Y2I564_TRAC3|nr:hypothetical protein PYCCODRAFT_123572 [Trametes coccinea BRFM310]